MLKRSIRQIAAPAVRLEALETRQLMAANAWKSAVSGNWNDATKWSLGHVPTKTEDVVISVAGNYTVTVGDGKTVYNPEINKLTLGGGSARAIGRRLRGHDHRRFPRQWPAPG